MLKRGVSVFIVIIIFLFIIVNVISFTQGVAKAKAEVKIDSKVYEQIGQEGDVRVFIKLKNVSETEINSNHAEKEEKDAEREIGKEIKYDFGETISAEVDIGDIKRLESNLRIESISVVGVKYLFLEDGISLVNSSKAHSLVYSGQNITGKDQAVCIIDSGVDYTHSSLGGCFGFGCKVIGGYDFVNSDSNPLDDHGHGTHVAGIVAANGSVTGIAPEASLVSIKACDSDGVCYDDDIIAGINWCIGNATNFNISVISMSFGAGLYSPYCNDDTLAEYIQNAVNNNISVVISSGNGLNNEGIGRVSQISSPACVENSTAVSATDKSDVIDTNYADRNALVLLMAPGSLITSTMLGGGTEIRSGTSMSAPHVAGAIAILNQYISLTAQQEKTPMELEDILNSTGKIIIDSAVGAVANYSRINIYDALVSLDSQNPNVGLDSPSDLLSSLDKNKTLRCSADDLSLRNITLQLWNSTLLYYNSTDFISGDSAYTLERNITEMPYDTYHWNCVAVDLAGNEGTNSNNYTLYISNFISYQNAPENNKKTNVNQTMTCNASTSSDSLNNITLNLWNSTTLEYTETFNVSGTENSTNFAYNFTHQGNYEWACVSADNSALAESRTNYTIQYDLTKPEITTSSPTDGYSQTGAQSIIFYYNVTDNLNMTSCYLYYGSAIQQYNTTSIVLGETNNITKTVAIGSHSWKIMCEDKAGNLGNSSLKSLTVNEETATVAGSSGGGGGGGTTKIYTITEAQVGGGYNQNLGKGDKISFSAGGNQHSLTINKIDTTKNNANVSVRSELITFVLSSGEMKKINLTSSKFYDLYIKLEDIANYKANITIKTIKEEIPNLNNRNGDGQEESNQTNSGDTPRGSRFFLTNSEKTKSYLIITIIIIFVIAVLFLLWKYKYETRHEVKYKFRHKRKNSFKEFL